jgi:hypothetical protein
VPRYSGLLQGCKLGGVFYSFVPQAVQSFPEFDRIFIEVIVVFDKIVFYEETVIF